MIAAAARPVAIKIDEGMKARVKPRRMLGWPNSNKAMTLSRLNVTIDLVSFSTARCAAPLPTSSFQEPRNCKT